MEENRGAFLLDQLPLEIFVEIIPLLDVVSLINLKLSNPRLHGGIKIDCSQVSSSVVWDISFPDQMKKRSIYSLGVLRTLIMMHADVECHCISPEGSAEQMLDAAVTHYCSLICRTENGDVDRA